MVKKIPDTENTLVLRTDYSNQEVWEAIRKVMLAPIPIAGFETQAYVDIVEDPAYQNMTVEDVIKNVDAERVFLFIVDNITLSHPEHPLLCVDLYDEPGQTFRLIPSELAAVENNLSIANLDFVDFKDNVDADGIFRGFEP